MYHDMLGFPCYARRYNVNKFHYWNQLITNNFHQHVSPYLCSAGKASSRFAQIRMFLNKLVTPSPVEFIQQISKTLECPDPVWVL